MATVALLALSFGVSAKTFYKWTDARGEVHYGDEPPKNFAGPVTRVEVDTTQQPAAPLAPKAPVVVPAPAAAPAEPDLLTQRRATRALLEANLAKAREHLDLARKALAEATNAGGDEEQYTQRRVDPGSVNPNQFDPNAANPNQPVAAGVANPDATQSMPAQGGMLGMAPRSNCRTVKGASGKPVLICPTVVPSSAYYERVQRLEDDVKRAEEEVAAAETAYRRGVD